MKSYIVIYTLRKLGTDYEGLQNAIKSYGTWAHLDGSVWIIKSNLSAQSIRDDLRQHIDDNDTIFVGGYTGVSAWHNISGEVAKWLMN